MANKNITINQFDGTSYNSLFPATASTTINPSSTINDYYGLSSDSSLDDVLEKIPTSVGTIEYSVKNSSKMGEKYLYCDGSQLDEDSYPELANLLETKKYPDSIADFVKYNLTVNSDDMLSITGYAASAFYWIFIEDLKYINGYWVGRIAYKKDSSTAEQYKVGYTSDLSIPFRVLNIDAAELLYCGNYIVAFSHTNQYYDYTGKVATDPSGTWSDGPTFTLSAISASTLSSLDVLWDGT